MGARLPRSFLHCNHGERSEAEVHRRSKCFARPDRDGIRAPLCVLAIEGWDGPGRQEEGDPSIPINDTGRRYDTRQKRDRARGRGRACMVWHSSYDNRCNSLTLYLSRISSQYHESPEIIFRVKSPAADRDKLPALCSPANELHPARPPRRTPNPLDSPITAI